MVKSRAFRFLGGFAMGSMIQRLRIFFGTKQKRINEAELFWIVYIYLLYRGELSMSESC